MSGYFDIYGLAPSRSHETVDAFLAAYVTGGEPSQEDWALDTPAGGITLDSPGAVIIYSVSDPFACGSLYWHLPDRAHANCTFTSDGFLILGLSVVEQPERWREKLTNELGCSHTYVAFEEPPAHTHSEFLDQCETWARAWD